MNLKILALAAACGIAMPGLALAGECPADQRGTDVRAMNATPASGVTDTVLTTLDVANAPAMIDGRLFRMRRLEIQPNGVVPWHSHADRPAIIYVVQGSVTEYQSNCKVPIVHNAGEATPELAATSHWWRNTGTTTAILLSADLLPVAGHDEMH